jgi:hypothetical protein
MSEIFNVCISIGGWPALLINNFHSRLSAGCRCDIKANERESSESGLATAMIIGERTELTTE